MGFYKSGQTSSAAEKGSLVGVALFSLQAPAVPARRARLGWQSPERGGFRDQLLDPRQGASAPASQCACPCGLARGDPLCNLQKKVFEFSRGTYTCPGSASAEPRSAALRF